MKAYQKKAVYPIEEKVVTMNGVQIPFEERDVDLSKVKKMAEESSNRIQKDKDDRLERAIKQHDSYYIGCELSNISTFGLLKMILKKIL